MLPSSDRQKKRSERPATTASQPSIHPSHQRSCGRGVEGQGKRTLARPLAVVVHNLRDARRQVQRGTGIAQCLGAQRHLLRIRAAAGAGAGPCAGIVGGQPARRARRAHAQHCQRVGDRSPVPGRGRRGGWGEDGGRERVAAFGAGGCAALALADQRLRRVVGVVIAVAAAVRMWVLVLVLVVRAGAAVSALAEVVVVDGLASQDRVGETEVDGDGDDGRQQAAPDCPCPRSDMPRPRRHCRGISRHVASHRRISHERGEREGGGSGAPMRLAMSPRNQAAMNPSESASARPFLWFSTSWGSCVGLLSTSVHGEALRVMAWRGHGAGMAWAWHGEPWYRVIPRSWHGTSRAGRERIREGGKEEKKQKRERTSKTIHDASEMDPVMPDRASDSVTESGSAILLSRRG